MSLRDRIKRLEKLVRPDGFCCQCMVVVFRTAGEPDPRPPVCPRCGRGPGDYPPGTVRGFVLHRPPGADGQAEPSEGRGPTEPEAPPALPPPPAAGQAPQEAPPGLPYGPNEPP